MSNYKWVSVTKLGILRYYLVPSDLLVLNSKDVLYPIARIWYPTNPLQKLERVGGFYHPTFFLKYKKPCDRYLIPRVLEALSDKTCEDIKQELIKSIEDRNCLKYKIELL